ncbi:MAG: cob(I)yrinic acid a,c-diamide adenosyltransferase [Rhodospirillaceae bacterium]
MGDEAGDEAGDENNWGHKMDARKAFHQAKIAERNNEKGLLIVHTGNGKGKTTAALGLILRAAGHGMAVGLVQFVKGSWSTGELAALARFDDLVTVRVMGEGFTWETRDRARDCRAAGLAWDMAISLINDRRYRLVVLDELSIALRYEFLPVADVVATLAARPAGLHIAVTGRHAPPALINAADLVTEMRSVKHPYQAGIKAQLGIEY